MDLNMIFQDIVKQEKFAKEYHLHLKAREDLLANDE